MPEIDALLARNQAFAATGAHNGLSPIPKHQLFVITCMDPGVDPAAILGLELGDALVIRNAGGRVTDEVIAAIAFVAHLGETMLGAEAPPFEVAVIHHTSCGTGLLADADFRRGFVDRIEADGGALAAQAVVDPAVSVHADVERLRRSTSLPDRASASGHVYDVETGTIQTLVSDSAGLEPGERSATEQR